jgi:hypothetical protein
MKAYDCKLRLAGSVTNEVPKMGVSAAEIEVLREIHGNDAVVDIKEIGDLKRDSAAERAHLKRLYANPETLNTQQFKRKAEMLRNLFGHDRLPLPADLAEVAPRDDEEVDEPVTAAPVRRTRVAKPAETFTA